MTWAATGTLIQATASTFTLTPGQVGEVIVVEVANISNNTVYASALSSANVSWYLVNFYQSSGAHQAGTVAVFVGTVTSASSATVTVTWSGTAPASIRIAGRAFTTTLGNWEAVETGWIDSGGTNTWPALSWAGGGAVSPPPGGVLYWGYAINNATAVAGTTSGFTYEVDSHGNGEAFDVNCGTASTAPVWGDSTQLLGMMVLIGEAPSNALTVSAAETAGQDSYGNYYYPGFVTYGYGSSASIPSGICQQNNGGFQLGSPNQLATSPTGFPATWSLTSEGVGGEDVTLSGGGQSNTDVASGIELQSQGVSGFTGGKIFLAAGVAVQLCKIDNNAYRMGHLIIESSPAQLITATSGSPASVSGCSVPVGVGSYKIRLVVQYAGSTSAGAAWMGLVGPSASKQWISGLFSTTSTTGGGNQTAALGYLASPTLSTANWTLFADGFASFTASGTLTLKAYCGTSGDNYTIKNVTLELYPQ